MSGLKPVSCQLYSTYLGATIVVQFLLYIHQGMQLLRIFHPLSTTNRFRFRALFSASAGCILAFMQEITSRRPVHPTYSCKCYLINITKCAPLMNHTVSVPYKAVSEEEGELQAVQADQAHESLMLEVQQLRKESADLRAQAEIVDRKRAVEAEETALKLARLQHMQGTCPANTHALDNPSHASATLSACKKNVFQRLALVSSSQAAGEDAVL